MVAFEDALLCKQLKTATFVGTVVAQPAMQLDVFFQSGKFPSQPDSRLQRQLLFFQTI